MRYTHDVFARSLKRVGRNHVAIVQGERQLSFGIESFHCCHQTVMRLIARASPGDVEDYSNQVAHFFLSRGLQMGDTVVGKLCKMSSSFPRFAKMVVISLRPSFCRIALNSYQFGLVSPRYYVLVASFRTRALTLGTQIGGRICFVNYNQTHETLLHAIKVFELSLTHLLCASM